MNDAAPPTRTGPLIVIPTLNEARNIGPLLELLMTEARLLGGHIVVVDGGSTDSTAAIAAGYAERHEIVSLLHNPRRLQSAAMNLAVRELGAGRRYVIRIDAHGGYPRDYCRALLREAETMGADSVVVPMKTVGFGLFQSAVATAQNSMVGTGGASHRTGNGGKWVEHGHHALMSIAAFEQIGGYDETFRANEDAELDFRLRQAGYHIWLTAGTHMAYYPRSSPAALFRQYLNYGRGRARNVLKHRAMPRIRQLAPLAVVPAAALAVLSVFHWSAALPLLCWALLCLALGGLAAMEHRQVQSVPVGGVPLVGLAAMIMHFAWSLGFWTQLARTIGRRQASN